MTSIAKIVGTLVTVAGAMLMTLYKGPIVEVVLVKHAHYKTNGSLDRDWLLGCIFLVISTFAWASLFVLQVSINTVKRKKNGKNILKKCVNFCVLSLAVSVFFCWSHTNNWHLLLCYWTGKSYTDIQESSANPNFTCVPYRHYSSYCCYLYCWTQPFCLENWMGYKLTYFCIFSKNSYKNFFFHQTRLDYIQVF